MPDDHVLEVAGLRHAFSRRAEVLRGADLRVARGSFTALLGLNGAGKTTLIRSVMGLIRPREGKIRVLGRELDRKPLPPEILSHLGYVPEHPFAGERMAAGRALDLVRHVHPRWHEQTAGRYLRAFNIPLSRSCKDLSSGTRAQLALVLAMAGRPDLLILDEPTLGLDPLHRKQYLQLLLGEAMEQGITVLLTSHDLHQIERMADTVAILHEGRIMAASLDELKERVKRIRVGASAPGPELAAVLGGIPGVMRLAPDPGGYLISTVEASEELVARIGATAGVGGVQVLDLSLEEIFLLYCGE